MMYRIFPLLGLCLALFIGAPALAATDANETTYDGKVVSIAGDKLVIRSTDGKEHSHTLAADAKVTCDGKVCKSADLRPGMKIRATTKKNDKQAASRIEAIDKRDGFDVTHDGKVTSTAGHQLIMTSADGKEYSHTLTSDAKVTCDGRVCKSADLRPGMRIRVTTKKDDKQAATRIEALDNRDDFEVTHDGKVVSIAGNRLVMTNKDRKEHICTLDVDTTLTCDGKTCQGADLKPGMNIRVTMKNDEPAVTRIEALDKHDDFEKRG